VQGGLNVLSNRDSLDVLRRRDGIVDGAWSGAAASFRRHGGL